MKWGVEMDLYILYEKRREEKRRKEKRKKRSVDVELELHQRTNLEALSENPLLLSFHHLSPIYLFICPCFNNNNI